MNKLNIYFPSQSLKIIVLGINQRFGHLADIGISAVWLSPIFVSPMKDFGYDIADFYKIAEEYGTLDNLKELLVTAKQYGESLFVVIDDSFTLKRILWGEIKLRICLGIRVLLDFVPNHSSDQCEWFKLSANKTAGYENYYVWHPGKPNPTGGRNLPPSNWVIEEDHFKKTFQYFKFNFCLIFRFPYLEILHGHGTQ